MAKLFEDYFMEIQTDMVATCLEYCKKKAEKIYIYGSIENGSTFFNVFFQLKNKILKMNELNSVLNNNEKIDDTSDKQFSVLEYGIEDLERIEELCKKHNKDIPTEFKLEYDVLKNSLEAHYQYDEVLGDDLDKSNYDVFNEWITEIKNKQKAMD